MTVFDNFFQSFQLKVYKQKINECIQFQTIHHFLDTCLRVLNSVIGHTVLKRQTRWKGVLFTRLLYLCVVVCTYAFGTISSPYTLFSTF